MILTQLRIILFCIPLLWSSNLVSQNTNWIKHEKSKGWDVSGPTLLDQTGNIYVIMHFGDSVYIGGQGYKPCGYGNFLVKYSPAGQVLSVQQVCPAVSAIIFDNNGNLIVGANTALFKYDTSGNLLWQSPFGTGAGDVACDVNGNLYTATNLSVPWKSAFTIRKYSATGNLVWEIFSDTVQYCRVNQIATDSLDNIFIQGTASESLTLGSFPISKPYDVMSFIAKIDSQGNVLWVKKEHGWMDVSQMEITKSGEILMAGKSDDHFSVVGTDTVQEEDCFISKYDSNANSIWINPTSAKGISFSDKGSTIFIAGHFLDTGQFYNNALTFFSPNQWSFYIMKLNSNGQVQKYYINYGKSRFQFINQICADNSGNIITTGWFTDTLYYVGKLVCNEALAPSPGDIFVAKFSDVLNVGIQEQKKEITLNIFPNPTSSVFNLKSESENQKTVSVFDVVGNLVFTHASTNKNFEIDLKGKPKGIYIVKIHSIEGTTTRKVILE